MQRLGRRGLPPPASRACSASSAPYLAVIDGDLQHDERLLPHMLAELKQGETDMVVGSRYAPGGGTGDRGAARVG